MISPEVDAKDEDAKDEDVRTWKSCCLTADRHAIVFFHSWACLWEYCRSVSFS